MGPNAGETAVIGEHRKRRGGQNGIHMSSGDDFSRGGITGSGQASNSSMAWPICRARRTHAAVDRYASLEWRHDRRTARGINDDECQRVTVRAFCTGETHFA